MKSLCLYCGAESDAGLPDGHGYGLPCPTREGPSLSFAVDVLAPRSVGNVVDLADARRRR